MYINSHFDTGFIKPFFFLISCIKEGVNMFVDQLG